jgi:hypothetical protein
MNQRFHLVVGALVASVLSGCHCTQVAQICQSNTDCSGGRVCVAGQCGFPGDGGPGGGDGGDGGPGGGDGGCVNLQCNQVTCPDGGTTTITGTVYDPSGAIPIYNALVYVPNGPVLPFTPGVTCDRCAAFTSGSPLVVALTGSDGHFTLRNVPVMPDGGTLPLVIQVGRWRRQVALPGVPACTSTPITDAGTTRLPQNQSEGDMPQMAIASGSADPFQCLLLKMGISTSEFTAPGGGGRVHYYRSNGMDTSPPAAPITALLDDAGTLMNYDVVLLPCEGSENRRTTGPEPQNLVAYTSAGGRLFTTHYGYSWLAFPENNPFPSTGVWAPGSCDAYNFTLPTTVDQTFSKGASFAQWLVNVGSSTDAGTLNLIESRHDLLFTDGGSQRWLYTNIPNAISTCTTQPQPAVLHMTFNTPLNPPPVDGGPGNQCGRVVYSDFHVSATAAGGGTFPTACIPGPLTAQEKALLFMLLDVSSCVQSDNATCATLGQSCSPNPCCSPPPGQPPLRCVDPSGQTCGLSGSCTCQPGLR